jgi:indolepyruvate ferredoxin oxidoreductase alpha subunit
MLFTPRPTLDANVSTRATLMSGDDAIAWAALDSGVRIASGYPGTPATDIQEAIEAHESPLVRCIWSINEKVAYETGLAAAIAGQRAIVSMKQVGLNVASDAFMNSCPAGVNAGLLLVIGDDPECHSSQNKQDTRYYQAMSGTILLEPSDPQEAYDMSREAFIVSEKFRLPVILRLTTRTAHACAGVERRQADTIPHVLNWPKEPSRFFIVPTVSRRLFLRLSKLQDEMGAYLRACKFFQRSDAPSPEKNLGVICTGVGFAFARELMPNGVGVLKVPGEPFPDDELASFVNAHDNLLVIEEGDPVLERRARACARRCKKIMGRLTGELKCVGELRPTEISAALLGQPQSPQQRVAAQLPPRLPEICKPCGYHKVFGALKRIPGLATPSDIGCNSLGGLPPYEVMDGVWAMGSSIGVACGLAAIGHTRVLAIIGDSTFYHAGIPPLIEAVHEGYTLTVLLLDNGTAAMTGGQSVAHRTRTLKQTSVDLVKLIQAMGVKQCISFDPHVLGEEGIRKLVEDSFEESGVKVLLYRSQCGIYSPGYGSGIVNSASKSHVAIAAVLPQPKIPSLEKPRSVSDA